MSQIRRKRIRIILGLMLCGLIILFLSVFKHKDLNYELKEIASVKYFEPTEKIYAYRGLTLTPVEYGSTLFTKTVVAKAVYKNDTIGFRIDAPRLGTKIFIRSIGKESDRFVKAISELYEEEYDIGYSMKPEIEGAYLFSKPFFTDWSKDPDNYKLGLEDASVYLYINIPNRSIEITDQHNGLAKKRFVKAFIK